MQQTSTYILGIGSNHHAEKNLRYAQEKLAKQYPDIRFSTIYHTEPIGLTMNQTPFQNQLGLMHTNETAENISHFLKQLEKECGRTAEDKIQEIIKLDLDILQINDNPLKPQELQRPYYQKALQELQQTTVY